MTRSILPLPTIKHSLFCRFLVCLFTIASADAQSHADDFRPLFNGMNEDGVRDILSGGDAKSEVFS